MSHARAIDDRKHLETHRPLEFARERVELRASCHEAPELVEGDLRLLDVPEARAAFEEGEMIARRVRVVVRGEIGATEVAAKCPCVKGLREDGTG